MNESTKTKKALRGSLFALFLCIVLLIGTTFAWFTDSVSTGVNKIQAGNLKVGFEYWDGEKYVDAKDATLFSEDTLWEPGHTEVVYLKVSNKGNLALKYRLNTINTWEWKTAQNSNGDTILLSKYLQIGIAEGKNAAKGKYASREEALAAAKDNLVSYDSYTKENALLPSTTDSESADYLAFVVHMPETVGNEANSVNGNSPAIRFNLALTATQVNSESDSFGPDYDKNAPYSIVGANPDATGTVLYDELEKNTPSIVLGGNASRYYGWFVKSQTTIDMNGKTLSTTGYQSVVNVSGNGDLTLTGKGTVDATKSSGSSTAVTVTSGGKVTIENGTYIGKAGNSCIYDGGGTVVIKGGFFKCEGSVANGKYVLNQNNGTHGTITVMGGTFVNYDPSKGDDNLGGNFVADGYKVVSETQSNGDVWYKVVKK